IKERVEQFVQVPVIEDIPHYKGNGPLAGIVSGMEYIEADWYAIMPCDAQELNNCIKDLNMFKVKNEL
ncbi:molybdenum cofactor guanylyltransferase, partial [Escherichia sp. SS-MK2]